MDCEVSLEVVGVDLGHAGPSDDARIVDKDVDAPELLDRGGDERLRSLGRSDVAGVGDGGAAGGGDLGYDRGRGLGVGAVSLHRAAEVVDDDARAAFGEQPRVGAADPASRAGDDGDASVETVLVQAGTGALNPRRPPSVPPSMAARSSAGTSANCDAMSFWLPRNVPSACG